MQTSLREQIVSLDRSQEEKDEIIAAIEAQAKLLQWPDFELAISQLAFEEKWVETIAHLPPMMFVAKSRRIQLRSAIRILEGKVL